MIDGVTGLCSHLLLPLLHCTSSATARVSFHSYIAMSEMMASLRCLLAFLPSTTVLEGSIILIAWEKAQWRGRRRVYIISGLAAAVVQEQSPIAIVYIYRAQASAHSQDCSLTQHPQTAPVTHPLHTPHLHHSGGSVARCIQTQKKLKCASKWSMPALHPPSFIFRWSPVRNLSQPR